MCRHKGCEPHDQVMQSWLWQSFAVERELPAARWDLAGRQPSWMKKFRKSRRSIQISSW